MADPSHPSELEDARHLISELQTALAAKEKELKAARKFNIDQLIKARETEEALRILKEQVGYVQRARNLEISTLTVSSAKCHLPPKPKVWSRPSSRQTNILRAVHNESSEP